MESVSKKTVLNLNGATCTSCVYTIEHVGKRIKGITDVQVDRANQEVTIEYTGDEKAIDKLITVVQRIGYNAWPKTDS